MYRRHSGACLQAKSQSASVEVQMASARIGEVAHVLQSWHSWHPGAWLHATSQSASAPACVTYTMAVDEWKHEHQHQLTPPFLVMEVCWIAEIR